MPYDKKSFLAGLAAGRTMWRPPFLLPQGEGYGWTADPEYLLFDAGIIATADHSDRTPYIKLNSGVTVAIYYVNGTTQGYGSDWVGIYMISTNPLNSMLYLNTERGWWTSVMTTFTYLGLTWYAYQFGQNSQWGGGTSLNTDIQEWDATGYITGYPDWNTPANIETCIAILEVAGVRRTS